MLNKSKATKTPLPQLISNRSYDFSLFFWIERYIYLTANIIDYYLALSKGGHTSI
uniref:Uncharacterized protein n=1 Tax=Rhizophora mucronata TaxID=61149 RepID=A0A2P2MU97_RHIMU